MEQHISFPDVIELNVGGKLLTTLLSTLTKDPESMLAAMFSGRHVISKDKDGRYFIDCDGDSFRHLLNFLRFDTLPPKEKVVGIYDLAIYFNVQSLVQALESYYDIKYRKCIEAMKSKLNIQEFERLKQEALQYYSSICAKLDETKSLIITNGRACSNKELCCTANVKVQCARLPLLDSISLILHTDEEITKELINCLIHDLRELGLGQYSYKDRVTGYQCYRCSCKGYNEAAFRLLFFSQKPVKTVQPDGACIHYAL